MTRRLTALAACLAAAAVIACGKNPYGPLPLFAVRADTTVAYALSGTPGTVPAALDLVRGGAVGIDGSASFDLAVDLDASGRVVLYPARLVVSPAVGTRLVGVRKTGEAFDAITSAPAGAYQTDTATVVSVGEAFVVETTRNGPGDPCQGSFTPQLYARVVVDSVNSGTRAMYIRSVLNPNCGVRSLVLPAPAK